MAKIGGDSDGFKQLFLKNLAFCFFSQVTPPVSTS